MFIPGIPDGINPIYIFVDDELWAYKYPDGPWMIKTSQCNKCGTCCTRFRIDRVIPPVKDGVCQQLEKGGMCKLGKHRPFKCMISTPSGDYCSVKFKQL